MSPDGAGRFAPSPSGALHLGNLRTALLAWLFARSTGRRFLLRIEDLDRVAPGAERTQLLDLNALGLDHDGPLSRQSEHQDRYAAATAALVAAGLTYECFCTRREIQQAVSAPHPMDSAAAGRYPGTCRHLTSDQVSRRRAAGRPPAVRLRAHVERLTVLDELTGPYSGVVEDIVLRRNDGLAAYNLAVVLDDAAQAIDQVVRGDDLLPATPAQAHLATLLDLPVPHYVHVPMALNMLGQRLAKRDGAVTMADLAARGRTPGDVLGVIATSLDLAEPGERVTPAGLLVRFDPAKLPRQPWIVGPELAAAELLEAAGPEGHPNRLGQRDHSV